ncbi:MAG: tetratricopeptide repeat protein, partial [Neisseriaceae bacterium]
MRRVIALFLLAISTTTFATTEQSLIAAGHAYSSNNINMLANLYSTNKNSPVISYLYARTLLTHMNNNTIAEHYVDYMPNSYMRNDLLHQLLISYYKNDSFSNFKSAYNKLNNSQIFANETCGYDVASIKLDKTYNTLTDLSWLSNNNITNWCADLGLLAYKNNKIPRADFNRMLNNLIIYGDYDSFNKLMPQLQMKPINFYKYKDMPYNRISHNRYLVIKYISNKAKKYPEDALQILNSSNLNEQDKTLLANYIALQFVANQKFAQAVRLFEKYNSNDISNDEFEWRARSYLALGKWSKLITAIKSMPDTLQNKNVWLYWLAKSYDGLGQYSKATYFLKKIPKDYSYYDLLAQGELETPTIFDTTIPKSISLGDSKFASDVNNALTIYRIGKSSHTHI